MDAPFLDNGFFKTIITIQQFDSEEKIIRHVKNHLEYDYASVTFENFSPHYVPEDWLKRKFVSLGHGLIGGLVSVIYQLVATLIVGLMLQSKKYCKVQSYYIAHTLQWSMGKCITVFHDQYGEYICQKSNFHLECYVFFRHKLCLDYELSILDQLSQEQRAQLAIDYIAIGSLNKARTVINRCEDSEETHELRYQVACFYYDRGKIEKALQVIQESNARDPAILFCNWVAEGNPKMVELIVESYLVREQKEDAIALINSLKNVGLKSICKSRVALYDVEICRKQVSIYLEKGAREPAISLIRSLRDIDQGECMAQVAQFDLRKGNFKLAIEIMSPYLGYTALPAAGPLVFAIIKALFQEVDKGDALKYLKNNHFLAFGTESLLRAAFNFYAQRNEETAKSILTLVLEETWVISNFHLIRDQSVGYQLGALVMADEVMDQARLIFAQLAGEFLEPMNALFNDSSVEQVKEWMQQLVLGNSELIKLAGIKEAQKGEQVPKSAFDEQRKADCDLLGLSIDATEAQITKAYHKMALKVHPDKVPPKERKKQGEIFQRLAAAYERLVPS